MSKSSTTLLVEALLALTDPTYIVNNSTSTLPSQSTSSNKIENLKGKGKQIESELSDNLEALSISDQAASTFTLPPAPVRKSINKLLRYTEHTILVPSTSSLDQGDSAVIEMEARILTSWKMSDFAYKQEPCPFPTRARGMFTEKISGQDLDKKRPEGENEYRIIARGYDKFFNVDEVTWTKWVNLPTLTSAPYELTHKSNGCIILICALSSTQILVTSKHSLGSSRKTGEELIEGEEVEPMSHAEVGEIWLMKHLEAAGKSKESLAATLWSRNLTAVAELCDDAFEEHVLAYPTHLTGLHLHGLNYNTPILATLPSSDVQSFATEWGLIPTPYTIFPSILSLKTYCENVELDGGIVQDGKIVPVEGFVVRGLKKKPTIIIEGQEETEIIEPFFWKVKFDQPYLMYREWRELTRKILLRYPEPSGIKVEKLKNPLSRLYTDWVEKQVHEDITKFKNWKHGRDIIKIREEFLIWKETVEGRQNAQRLGIEQERSLLNDDVRVFEKTLIVPVAIPGSGKTSLGLALSHILGVAHTQSDDITFKRSGSHFITAVKKLLSSEKIIYADKNNHLIKLREDLLSLARKNSSTTRTIAFVWKTATTPRDLLHNTVSHRIQARGENHQNLRASTDPNVIDDYQETIWKFFGQMQEFDEVCNKTDGEFDEIFEIDFEWNMKETLEKALEFLFEKGVMEEFPSTDTIDAAIKFVGEYKINDEMRAIAEAKKPITKKVLPPRYYGIAVEVDLKQHLAPYFSEGHNQLWNDLQVVDILKKVDRVETVPHITLVHEKEVESCIGEDTSNSATNLWNLYSSLAASPDSNSVEIALGPLLVYDSRVMSVQVSSITSLADPSRIIELVGNKEAHVTIGTLRHEIRPIEGKFIIEKALQGQITTEEGGEIVTKQIKLITCQGRIAGLR